MREQRKVTGIDEDEDEDSQPIEQGFPRSSKVRARRMPGVPLGVNHPPT